MSDSLEDCLSVNSVEFIQNLSSTSSATFSIPKEVAITSETKNRLTKRSEATAKTNSESAALKHRLTQPQCLSVKSGTSPIWNVGSFSVYNSKSLDDKNKVVCNTCVATEKYDICEIKLSKDGSPSNALSHLKSHHLDLYTKVVELKSDDKLTNSITLEQTEPVNTCVDTKLPIFDIRNTFKPTLRSDQEYHLIKFIVMKYEPLSIVEDYYFRNFVDSLRSHYPHTARKGLHQTLTTYKLKLSEAKQNMIGPLVDISASVDTWTSIANVKYSGITERYITEDFTLVAIPATVLEHNGDETIGSLNVYIEELSTRVASRSAAQINFVTDTAPNMVGMGRGLASWTGCVDHRLDLITKLAFSDPGIEVLMKKCRRLAGHHHGSTQATDTLKQQCKVYKMASVKIEQDVVTRFWSTNMMVESILSLKKPLEALNGTLPEDCRLTSQDWTTLDVLHRTLEPFMVAQKTLESGGVTSSKVIPLIYDLRKKLEKASSVIVDKTDVSEAAEASRQVKETTAKMLVKFNKKFGDGTKVTVFGPNGTNASEGPRLQPQGFTRKQVLATALDPRTMLLYGIPATEHARVHALLLAEAVQKKLRQQASSTTTPPPPLPPTALTMVSTGSSTGSDDAMVTEALTLPVEAKSYEEFVANAMKKQRVETASDTGIVDPLAAYTAIVQLELSHFKCEPVVDTATDPLQWWRERSHMYPFLAAVARDVLAIPATSADAERLFSKTGLVDTAKRNRLTGDTVTLLVWLRQAWGPIEAFFGRRVV